MSDLETLEFDAERREVAAAGRRLESVERHPGQARRMLREAFETVAAALGDRPLSVRMLQHAKYMLAE